MAGATGTGATTDEATEEAWTVPTSWWRHVVPIRGHDPFRAVAPDPKAAEATAELLAAHHDEVLAAANHPVTDAALGAEVAADVAARQGGGREASTPRGIAGVVSALALAAPPWQKRVDSSVLADDLVLAHGVAVAAEVGVLLGRVAAVTAGDGPDRAIVEGDHGAFPRWVAKVHDRLCVLLAGTDDEAGHAAAVARVADLRTSSGARVAAATMLPSEEQWVLDVVADAEAGDDLAAMQVTGMASRVRTRADLERVLGFVHQRWVLLGTDENAHSAIAHVGPPIAPILGGCVHDLVVGNGSGEIVRLLAEPLGLMPTDEAVDGLIAAADDRHVRAALVEASARSPHRVLRRLASAVGDPAGGLRPAARSAAGALLETVVVGHLATAQEVLPTLPEAARPKVAAVVDRAAARAAVPRAPLESLPAVLARPPWTTRGKPPKPVVLDLPSPARPTTVTWLPGEQERWADTPVTLSRRYSVATAQHLADALLGYEGAQALALAPPALALPHLGTPSDRPLDAGGALVKIVGRFGVDGIPFVLGAVRSAPGWYCDALLPVDGSEVAEAVLGWLGRAKRARPFAHRWLARHPEAAADVVVAALGKPNAARRTAETALRSLDRAGHGGAVRAAASAHGAEAEAAIEAVLATAPLDVLPATMPKLPTWADPPQLAPVLVSDRSAALPDEAVAAVVTMLAISTPESTYAGVEVVREATDPASLAELGWSLLTGWLQAGATPKEAWALDGLRLIGDDETVRRLTPLIQRWPGEKASSRAVAGLDVLAAIGTDVALMHLNGIAERVKFAGVRAAAHERIEEVAEGLGLTRDELADRLVPTFGLDGDGMLDLDYGPRRFRAGFDEQLRPVVFDEDGTPRKALPKPSAGDDASLAPTAEARFKGLKKDVRTVAGDQVRRFEQAMVRQRRWVMADVRRLFVDHPLLWHLARRLVWATYSEDGAVTGAFRVAEDRTLADVTDTEVEVPDDAVVGVAHPVELADAGAWADLFADYGILQPFAQLGREVRTLAAEERAAATLDRFVGTVVPTGRLLGLTGPTREWERGQPMEGGMQGEVLRLVPGGTVVVGLDPGIQAGEPDTYPEQTITAVRLEGDGDPTFALLDGVTASEVLRDLEALGP